MLISLSLQIFTHNKKRTFQAVSLLAISVGLFVSSSLIVSGFSTELTSLTSILPLSYEYIVIKHGTSITTSTITDQEIEQLTQEFQLIASISGILPFKIETANFTVLTHKVLTYVMQVNYTRFNMYYKKTVIASTVTDGIVVSTSFARRYDLNYNQSTLLNNKQAVIQGISYFPTLMEDWIITNQSTYLLGQPGNVLLLKFHEDTSTDIINRIIKSYPDLEFISLDQAHNFLMTTSKEFIQTIFYFTLGFMILTMLAIGYTIMTLVRESEQEIVLFRILGFTPEQVMLIFLFQAIYIGVFGSFFAVSTGVLLTMALISLTTIIMQTPYFIIVIDGFFFLKIMGLSVLVSIISSIPATLYTEILFKRSLK